MWHYDCEEKDHPKSAEARFESSWAEEPLRRRMAGGILRCPTCRKRRGAKNMRERARRLRRQGALFRKPPDREKINSQRRVAYNRAPAEKREAARARYREDGVAREMAILKVRIRQREMSGQEDASPRSKDKRSLAELRRAHAALKGQRAHKSAAGRDKWG